MSMIVYMSHQGKLWVYSDTRVSAKGKDGLDYYIHDNYEKAKIINNMIVVGIGYLPAVKYVFEHFKRSDRQIHDLEQITRDAYDIYGNEIGMYIFTCDKHGVFWVYTISNLLDFKAQKERIRNNDLGVAGANSDEALQYIYMQLSKGVSPHDAILAAYQHVSNEKVGGTCHLNQLEFVDSFTRKINRYKYKIDDKSPLRQYNLRATMDGRAKFKQVKITDGLNTALLDSNTRKFYLNERFAVI